ncbi:MAG: hypothetical protein HQL52_13755 [Magnetococcales bacterium]|nr:hypothetical protein [Magnetococcales bacterium]
MTSQELHHVGSRLFGPGLISRVYIKSLAQELGQPEARVRQWWYGIQKTIPQEVPKTLERIEMSLGCYAG